MPHRSSRQYLTACAALLTALVTACEDGENLQPPAKSRKPNAVAADGGGKTAGKAAPPNVPSSGAAPMPQAGNPASAGSGAAEDAGMDDLDAGAAGSGGANTSTAGAGGSAPLTCSACRQTGTLPGSNNCPSALTHCESLTGVTSGSFMPGTSRRQLCRDILDCIQRTHCAKDFNDTDCLCGANVPTGQCFMGSFEAMTGACRDVMAAGAESNLPGELSLRFSDATYPLGAAITLLENCDFVECLQCL